MYRHFILLVMGFLMISTYTPRSEQEQLTEQTTSEADVAAINEIWNQYALSVNSGDLDTWISLWTDDGIQMAPDAPAVIGKEQILAKYKNIFPQFIFKMAITNKEIRVAGDWAFSRGTYTASMIPRAGGDTTNIDGKYLTILERQADSSWKIFRDCFNSNVSPPK